MDSKTKTGSLTLKFKDAHLSQSVPDPSSIYYLKISFGNNHYTTSTSYPSHKALKWSDSMKFIKTSEETLTIECFSKSFNNDLRLASALFPIQTVVLKGVFKGLIFLMSFGKVVLRLGVEIVFEERSEEHLTVVYPLPPPAFPHLHAYSLPPNFTYTPPGYYHASNGDLERN